MTDRGPCRHCLCLESGHDGATGECRGMVLCEDGEQPTHLVDMMGVLHPARECACRGYEPCGLAN